MDFLAWPGVGIQNPNIVGCVSLLLRYLSAEGVITVSLDTCALVFMDSTTTASRFYTGTKGMVPADMSAVCPDSEIRPISNQVGEVTVGPCALRHLCSCV